MAGTANSSGSELFNTEAPRIFLFTVVIRTPDCESSTTIVDTQHAEELVSYHFHFYIFIRIHLGKTRDRQVLQNAAQSQANSAICSGSLEMFARGAAMPLVPITICCVLTGPSLQVAVYGKCIVADYNSVHKDMCAKEFMKLKDCYLVRSCLFYLTCLFKY
jgi:hypothetical protein